MISLCLGRLPDCSKKWQMTLKVLNSAMIDCSRLCKGMQRLHRSFSSLVTPKPNHSYEILPQKATLRQILIIFHEHFNFGMKREGLQIAVFCWHSLPDILRNCWQRIWRVYVSGFQDTTYGTSLNMGQHGPQREKKKCVCHVLGDIHTNLVHTGLQTYPRDRPPT